MGSYQYVKKLEIAGQFEVIVAGGGPAGFCAAIQAARGGAKTALVERHSMLGGTITTGGNPQIGLFYKGSRQIIGGIGFESVKTLHERGYAVIPEFLDGIPHSQQNVTVNIPMYAKLLDDMCLQAGVSLFFHTTVADAICIKDQLTGIVVSNKDGLSVLEAKVFIDCTGDADLCQRAGAEYELGDEKTKELQPGTLRFFLDNFRLEDIDQTEVEEKVERAFESGELNHTDMWGTDAPYELFATKGNNINHIKLNAVEGKSKSAAEIEARASVEKLILWLRKNITGCGTIEALFIGNEVAVRESRRVICDTYITADGYMNAKVYEDGICYSYYPIDLHKADGADTLKLIHLQGGGIPQIPYSAMTVKGFQNLLVAGRCISGDRLANSAYRVKASCMAMGQAAGAAAAEAVLGNVSLRDVDLLKVKKLLKENGAIVPNDK